MKNQELLSPVQKKKLRRDIMMVNDYKKLYVSVPSANQLKTFGVLAERYGYSSAESVRCRFQTLKRKYGPNFIEVLEEIKLN